MQQSKRENDAFSLFFFYFKFSGFFFLLYESAIYCLAYNRYITPQARFFFFFSSFARLSSQYFSPLLPHRLDVVIQHAHILVCTAKAHLSVE
jgi:hypothetical protein